MTAIDPGIFKKYDIRGRAMGADAVLTTEAATHIGQSIGTFFQRMHEMQRVVVGRDNRHTSFDLQSALVDGLVNSGMEVIDIGLVSTPVVYWHAVNEGNIAGVMVTGSHLKPPFNGFKLCLGNRPIYNNDIQMLRMYIENSDLITSETGSIIKNEVGAQQFMSDILARVNISKPLKVVVDPGNGTGGLFAPYLLENWDMDVTGIFMEPDADYPNHQPDPQKEANVAALKEKVVQLGADIGLAFDGDADRVGVVDEKGNLISADRVLALLAQDMLARHPGAVVVADVLSSQVLFDAVKNAGGVPVMAASGHAMVKDMMREKDALLGGEMSGHIFPAEDYFGFDDSFLVAGRILQLLADSGKTMSELDESLPRLYSTPEYRPHCPDEDKGKVIEATGMALMERGEITDVDGVRVQFEKGWGILRASNTEPVLSLRFEAETEAAALEYRDLFAQALAAFPQVEKFV